MADWATVASKKVGFNDDYWIKVEGNRCVIEVTDEAIYLAIAVPTSATDWRCSTAGTRMSACGHPNRDGTSRRFAA